VQVCPTGIDIRHGPQMECIGCAACVDACDAVMEKLQRPKGLVRYDSANGLAGKPTRWIRPRIILYTCLMALGAIAMTAGLSTLRPANASFVRMTGSPYFLDGAMVRNQFMLKVLNQRNMPVTFRIEFVDAPPELNHTGASEPISVDALGEASRPIILVLPREKMHELLPIRVRVVSADRSVVIEKTLPFVGPGYYGQ
jgi:polyferredoxin